MRLRTTTISMLAIGLLAGSAAGVAAQDEGLDSREPAVFVWDIVDGTEAGVTIEATDPRASGLLVFTEGGSLYLGGKGYALALSDGDATLSTEGGSWAGTSEAFNAEKFLAPQVDRGIGIIDMAGDDAYQGLSLTLFTVGVEGDENPERWGYIYPADAMTPSE